MRGRYSIRDGSSENLLYIVDKDGRTIPFKFNREQRRLMEHRILFSERHTDKDNFIEGAANRGDDIFTDSVFGVRR